MKNSGTDTQQLVELLFRIGTDKHADRYIEQVQAISKRLYSDEVTRDLVIASSDAVKYLARLYLYANGDARSSDVLDAITTNFTSEITATTTLPRYFSQLLLLNGQDNALIDLPALSCDEQGNTVVKVLIRKPMYTNADFANRETVVNLLCFEVFNRLSALSQPQTRYEIDSKTLEWGQRETTSLIIFVMDEIIAGHVTACIQCSAPIYTWRKNSKPFCKTAHYNTYRKQALKLLESGASVEAVYDAFGAIPKATITEWAKPI